MLIGILCEAPGLQLDCQQLRSLPLGCQVVSEVKRGDEAGRHCCITPPHDLRNSDVSSSRYDSEAASL